ncbi:MAG: AI-2E family transporter [Tannerellaceae bacterium]|nr:AI-2E family transporter [Tannerellaceae bacterium]
MPPLFDKPFTFDRAARILFSALLIAGALYLLALLKNALLPFLIAWLLAYLMQPLVRFFQYKLKFKSRPLSISAVLLSLLILISSLLMLLIPSITEEAEKTILLMRKASDSTYIPFIPQAWQEYLWNNLDLERAIDMLSKDSLSSLVKEVAPRLWNLFTNTVSIIISLAIIFVIFLYFIFILLDYEKIANGWKKLIPDKYRPFVLELAIDVESSMNRYFRGQSLIALIVGSLLAIGFRIIDFPLGVTLGLFIGLLNLIPYLQAIGLIPMILLSLLKAAETGQNFWIIFGLGIIVLVIVQCIQDLILIPRIMGKAMGMNPAIILLSLSIWGSLLGFVGLIIALPLTTLCLSYYRRFFLK